MARVAKVSVDLEANSAKFTEGLNRADRALASSGAKWQKTLAGIDAKFAVFGKSIAGVLGGLSAGAAAQALYSTNAEFQKLNASLKTVTGSAAGARAAFEQIQKFAQQTPYAVAQVTEAFIKLKAMGLDASMDSLRSYGNTASAMGKDVMQFIEAVADASTFEFERLKEFGIKARQEADTVSFTFQGTTTKVGKNAADVEKYLRRIGEVQFAGAMKEQMDTLGGAASNLKDNMDALWVAIGEAGANKVMKDGIDAISEAVKKLTDSVKILSSERPEMEKWLAMAEKWESVRAFISLPLAIRAATGAKGPTGSDKLVFPLPPPLEKPQSKPQQELTTEEKNRVKKSTEKLKELEFEQAQLARTSREQYIYSALKSADVEITSRQGAAIAGAAGRLYDAQEALEQVNAREEEHLSTQYASDEARRKIADSMKLEVDSNEKLLAALRMSEAEYERVAAMLEIVNAYRQAGIEMSPEEVVQAEQVSIQLAEQRDEMDKLKQKHTEMKRLGTDVFHAIGTAAEDAALKFESLRSVLAGLMQDIARIFMRLAITKPLEGIAGNLFSQFSFGNLFGSSDVTTASYTTPSSAGWTPDTLSAGQLYASGGKITGPGGPRTDSILIAASNGEYMVNAKAAQKYLPLLEAINNDRLPRFADGGRVGSGMTSALALERGSGDNYVIDARGADREGLLRLEAMIKAINGSIEHRSVAAVAQAATRGGKNSSAIRGR